MGGGAVAVAVMAWGCALCLALAGGALLALLVQLLRWLRADGDLTLLWAERWGKKPGKCRPARGPRGLCRERGSLQRGWRGAQGCCGISSSLGLSVNTPQKCNLPAFYLDKERGAPAKQLPKSHFAAPAGLCRGLAPLAL